MHNATMEPIDQAVVAAVVHPHTQSQTSRRHATLARMSYKLAFMTVGILREPVGREQVQGFVDRIPSVYPFPGRHFICRLIPQTR